MAMTASLRWIGCSWMECDGGSNAEVCSGARRRMSSQRTSATVGTYKCNFVGGWTSILGGRGREVQRARRLLLRPMRKKAQARGLMGVGLLLVRGCEGFEINRERRDVDRSENLMEDPYGPVWEAMSGPVVMVKADDSLDSILENFKHFTGLPVVDENDQCIGIVSDKDVYNYVQGKGKAMSEVKVRDVMTTPPIVIKKNSPIAFAAGLMLQHKVHRLPVVDDYGKVIGIVTRTDLYEPLIAPVNPLLHKLQKSNIPEKSDTELD